MNAKKTSQILPALFAVICAALAGYFILIGSGMFTEPSVALILLATTTILLLSSSKKSFYFILLPLALLHAFYTPTGLNFGPPSYQYIASLFATDMLETKEFLLQIPVSSYLIAFAIPILIFLQYKSAVKFGIKFYRNKTFIALATLLFAYNMPLAEPIKETVSSTLKIVDEVQKLKQMSQSDNWGKSTLENSRYDDYVIVLGESARKDYHHAYGYPIENTPFMSSAKGTLIDGFRSAGTNTVASLRLMLTKIFDDKDLNPRYGYLNCYVSSIKKTDEFLKRVYDQLEENAKKNHRTFSMIYFSDHGLCHQQDEKNNILLFNQNCFSREHHNIPLFKISSDDTERKEYKVFKSGLNFLEGIANWIGIQNPQLTQTEDLFSNESDKNDFGLQKRIDEKYRKDDDPAIDIRPKH